MPHMAKSFSVKVKTGASRPGVVEIASGYLEVAVHARPEHGKANAEVIARLSEYFGVRKSQVEIIWGFTGPLKRITIDI